MGNARTAHSHDIMPAGFLQQLFSDHTIYLPNPGRHAVPNTASLPPEKRMTGARAERDCCASIQTETAARHPACS